MMQTIVKTVSVISYCAFIAACAVIQPLPDNKPVRLVFYNELNLIARETAECKYLGPIISSEGHWYTYIFISNTDLTQGAINDMYNQ